MLSNQERRSHSSPLLLMKALRSVIVLSSFFFIGTAFAQQTTTTFSQAPFTDVPTTSAQYKAIEYLRSLNVVKGYIDGIYKPNALINRAEFVEFIINPLILDTNGRGDCVQANTAESSTRVFFSDVSKQAWYANNVCFAKTKNIIDGYPNNTFRPGDAINFVEAAKIIANVFTLNIDAYQTGEFWYRPYVQSLSNSHAIPTSITRVSQNITRGEMAEMVYRLVADASTQSYMTFDSTRNTFTPHQAVVVPPPAPEPTPPAQEYSRPSRRSIIEAVRIRNASR